MKKVIALLLALCLTASLLTGCSAPKPKTYTVYDEINLKDLNFGKTYTVQGVLCYREEVSFLGGFHFFPGDPILDKDGNPVIVVKKVWAYSRNMKVRLKFEIPVERFNPETLMIVLEQYGVDM